MPLPNSLNGNKGMPNTRLIRSLNYEHLQYQQRIPVHSSLLYRSHAGITTNHHQDQYIYIYINTLAVASVFESSLFLIAVNTLCIFSTTQCLPIPTYVLHFYEWCQVTVKFFFVINSFFLAVRFAKRRLPAKQLNNSSLHVFILLM